MTLPGEGTSRGGWGNRGPLRGIEDCSRAPATLQDWQGDFHGSRILRAAEPADACHPRLAGSDRRSAGRAGGAGAWARHEERGNVVAGKIEPSFVARHHAGLLSREPSEARGMRRRDSLHRAPNGCGLPSTIKHRGTRRHNLPSDAGAVSVITASSGTTPIPPPRRSMIDTPDRSLYADLFRSTDMDDEDDDESEDEANDSAPTLPPVLDLDLPLEPVSVAADGAAGAADSNTPPGSSHGTDGASIIPTSEPVSSTRDTFERSACGQIPRLARVGRDTSPPPHTAPPAGLAARDGEVLRALAQMRLLSYQQVATMFFPGHASAARRRMRKLAGLGCVRIFEERLTFGGHPK